MSTNQVYALIAAVSAALGAFATSFVRSGDDCECPAESAVTAPCSAALAGTSSTASTAVTDVTTTNTETTVTVGAAGTDNTAFRTGTTTSN